MSLRVVAGALGGRRIQAPPGRATRPTRERVREAWFSALGERVTGARVLDLYAGSGALGIEALSRGAAVVHFVESESRTLKVLLRNLGALELTERARIHRGDAVRIVEGLVRDGRTFDLALADPPYGSGEADRLLRQYLRAPFATVLCIEHSADELAGEAADWRRRYGETTLSFFYREPGGTDDGA